MLSGTQPGLYEDIAGSVTNANITSLMIQFESLLMLTRKAECNIVEHSTWGLTILINTNLLADSPGVTL